MTLRSAIKPMNAADRSNYGYATLRNAAYEAVLSLWRRRRDEGWTQTRLAEALGRDAGWLSKNLRGPGNWTLRTIGSFVEALNGEVEIFVHAIEDPLPNRANMHAYSGYELPEGILRAHQPSLKQDRPNILPLGSASKTTQSASPSANRLLQIAGSTVP